MAHLVLMVVKDFLLVYCKFCIIFILVDFCLRQGTPGQNGSEGDPGPPGVKGDPGINGTNGLKGVPGEPGLNGTKGDIGMSGPPGSDGIPGYNGTNGMPGMNVSCDKLPPLSNILIAFHRGCQDYQVVMEPMV